MIFLGLHDNLHEEKPSFLHFENNWLPTNGRMDRPSYRDARMHLKMYEMAEFLSKGYTFLPYSMIGKVILSHGHRLVAVS